MNAFFNIDNERVNQKINLFFGQVAFLLNFFLN